jgi:hypothetical protein
LGAIKNTINITQSATKQAAVVRYDNVPIITSCVMNLTSHNPGTTTDDEILGQDEQEDKPSRGGIGRAEHQPRGGIGQLNKGECAKERRDRPR